MSKDKLNELDATILTNIYSFKNTHGYFPTIKSLRESGYLRYLKFPNPYKKIGERLRSMEKRGLVTGKTGIEIRMKGWKMTKKGLKFRNDIIKISTIKESDYNKYIGKK